ncbi:hypothetical protein OnM2_019059 [Erysiphe neolycopersici]|uniref:Uncharacterized protein n=1 Tax=Erysiphe neolycopersici TaxID=212602 RepID=A0A420I3V7_9PEZI|nr:hypothetical protein OnM2_019059 [Erysiphe neolycopersici]
MFLTQTYEFSDAKQHWPYGGSSSCPFLDIGNRSDKLLPVSLATELSAQPHRSAIQITQIGKFVQPKKIRRLSFNYKSKLYVDRAVGFTINIPIK